jgi:thiamine biosynthesis lipoprotein
MRDVGVYGGLVDVGGDMACFGVQADGELWMVDVAPVDGIESDLRLSLGSGAVATSGNYARYFEIDGRRYSQIIDPRTGRPTETTHAVTVVAPTAITADVWATALSILGAVGFERLPAGVEAMVVSAGSTPPRIAKTAGFESMVQPRVENAAESPQSPAS